MTILFLVVGFISGVLIQKIANMKESCGVIKVIYSDERNPYMFFQIKDDLSRITRQKTIQCDVEIIDQSQK